MTINNQKKKLRLFCSKKRKLLKRNDKNSSFKLVKNILKIEELKKVKIIASFISIKTEISTEPLNDYFFTLGKKVCLPVILNNNKHLIFRSYDKSTTLKEGIFNIPEPDGTKEELLPDMILTPCLAFDQFGYRLGYGGGYYDRIFVKLKKIKHPFVSVIVAYDGQKLNKVVIDQIDQKIDYILTEKKIYRPNENSFYR